MIAPARRFIERTLLRSLPLVLATALCSANGTPPDGGKGAAPNSIPHEEIAAEFRARHGVSVTNPEDLDLHGLMAAHFVYVSLGAFELYFPVSGLDDKQRLTEFRDACAALLGAQRRWIEWVDGGSEGAAELGKELDELAAWVRGWKVDRIRRAIESGAHDLQEALEASGELREIAARLREQMTAEAGPLHVPREEPELLRMALMPTRESFVELLCFSGWYRPELRSEFWQDGIEGWLEFRIDDVHVCAMEFLDAREPGDWKSGTSLNEESRTRLQQQVVQLALNQLLLSSYGGALPSAFLSGVSMNLVIDLFGEVDTRIDGDLSSRETSERSTFIAGGRSEGGVLPQNVADSSWRADKGKYHFVRALRQAQKNGAKAKGRSTNKLARFELRGSQSSEEHVLEAPFFGNVANSPEVPDGLRGEYLEFLRAYKSAFLFWLRTEAEAPTGEPEEAFAAFLRRMAEPENAERFGDLVSEIWGLPLSDAKLGAGSLEGRFLQWLSKQKSR